jgi:hypothetical protein
MDSDLAGLGPLTGAGLGLTDGLASCPSISGTVIGHWLFFEEREDGEELAAPADSKGRVFIKSA